MEASRPGKHEALIGMIVLLALAGIAAGVLFKQSRYDPAVFQAAAPSGEKLGASSDASPPPWPVPPPESLQPLTPPEAFDAENLSDKIDGKAELYLSAGFQSLVSRRFSLKESPEAWMEVYLYDMGDGSNAFSVFSTQKRADGIPVDWARHGYRTDNAVFFVAGSLYTEIVCTEASAPLTSRALEYGEKIAAWKTAEAPPEEGPALQARDLFPPQGLQEESLALLASNVFGFEALSNVWTARYLVDGTELRAFLSLRETPGEAAELARAFSAFLVEFGGTVAEWEDGIPGARTVEIFGMADVIFHRGPVLAGVHEADSMEAARRLARRLHESLWEAFP